MVASVDNVAVMVKDERLFEFEIFMDVKTGSFMTEAKANASDVDTVL